MAERRRLPVVQNASPPSSGEVDVEARPPWHWVGFGTVAIFAAWLPLAYVGGAISARVMAARFGPDASKEAIDLALAAMTADERARLSTMVALPTYLGLAIAAFAGGAIVGRFGGRGPSAAAHPARIAAAAGALTACVAVAIAWRGLTVASVAGAVITLAVAAGFAAWGGSVGAGKRRPTNA